MKMRISGMILSLVLTAAVFAGFTCISFAEAPADPDYLKVTSYFDHFVINEAIDDYAYGIVLSTSKEQPTSTDGVRFYKNYDGKITLGYGDLEPNKQYYLHICCREDFFAEDTSGWITYSVKTLKVPKPTSVKAVAGKKCMTVKWKSAGYDDFTFKIQYSAKGVKAKTATMKVNAKNYKSPSKKIKNLKKGKKYTVKIMAITLDGYKSDWSKAATSGKIK